MRSRGSPTPRTGRQAGHAARFWVAVGVAGLVAAGCSLQSGAGVTKSATTAAATSRLPDAPVVGLTVPWAVGGTRIERGGTTADFAGEWPTIPFDAVRLWDSRTAWLNLEPTRGQWDFTRLDAFVAKAQENGIHDLTLVLGGTPRWAASTVQETDAPWMGPGSASMPADLDDWRRFVSTVAERYRGRITAYEIGNEPNLRAFWSGTPEQWGTYVEAAVAALDAADPRATIVVAGPSLRTAADAGSLRTWLAAVEPRQGIDAVGIHPYPDVAGMAQVGEGVAQARRTLDDLGWNGTPIWATEVNVRGGAALAPDAQREAVIQVSRDLADAGAQRLYWYAWTDLGPADLIALQPGTPGARGLAEVATAR